MSAGAERPASMLFQDSQYNWTDDLPVCKQSGIFFVYYYDNDLESIVRNIDIIDYINIF